MKCPKCNAVLLIAERHGVEIDYCPDCRGLWLDRGELDKILDRSAPFRQDAAPSAPQPHPEGAGHHHPKRISHENHHDSHNHTFESHGSEHHRRKKKISLLDLLDF
ncbi:MAG: zf-TFIIB domain-containing protein [Thermodesulfobacteriota bacterium]